MLLFISMKTNVNLLLLLLVYSIYLFHLKKKSKSKRHIIQENKLHPRNKAV